MSEAGRKPEKSANSSRDILLSLLGCVLIYFWATKWIEFGPTAHGDRDYSWVAPHWTVILVWLPTVAAFWAGGPGYCLLLILGSWLISFGTFYAVILAVGLLGFVLTGDQTTYQHVSAWVLFLGWPLAFCGLVVAGRVSAENRSKFLEAARRLGREPLINLLAFLIAIVGLIWSFTH